MKEKIKNILENNTPDEATYLIMALFEENNYYRLQYLDGQDFEQKTHVWAKNKFEALRELEKICPNANMIFIDKM
jgi:hypothetical protein